MKVFIVLEKDLDLFESEILRISKNNHVVNTEFFKIDDKYFIRLECC